MFRLLTDTRVFGYPRRPSRIQFKQRSTRGDSSPYSRSQHSVSCCSHETRPRKRKQHVRAPERTSYTPPSKRYNTRACANKLFKLDSDKSLRARNYYHFFIDSFFTVRVYTNDTARTPQVSIIYTRTTHVSPRCIRSLQLLARRILILVRRRD